MFFESRCFSFRRERGFMERGRDKGSEGGGRVESVGGRC